MKQTALIISLLFLTSLSFGGESSGWKAGASATIITPEEYLWMAGYGGRKTPAEGKLTDLYAKALALEDSGGNRSVFITLDLVGIDRDTTTAICEELKKDGLERHQVAVNCSHTHSGPVVAKNLGPLHYWSLDDDQKGRIDRYAATLKQRVVQTARTALKNLAPVRLQWGSGYATFAVNRRENKPYDMVPKLRSEGTLKGPVDHDVPVLTVRDTAGEIRCIVFGYACHATVLSGNRWCADYPGYAQREVEKNYPGSVALFWAGCGADQNPLPRQTVTLAEQYGIALANSVSQVIAAPMEEIESTLATFYREVQAPLAKMPSTEALRALNLGTNSYEKARAKVLLDRIASQGSLESTYPYPIAKWVLGNQVEWNFMGGEVVVDYALRLKKSGHGIATWVAGYSNDVMAYIPSLRVLKEGGYEGGGSNVYYGLPGLWDETFEEVVIQTIQELK